MYNGITIRSRSPPDSSKFKDDYLARVDDLVHAIVYLLDGMIYFFFFSFDDYEREARVFHRSMDENFFLNIIDGNDATDDGATRSTIEIRRIPHY